MVGTIGDYDWWLAVYVLVHNFSETNLFQRGVEEVLVHALGAIQELPHDVEAVLQRQRHDTDRRAHTVATSDPIPETKHVGWVDAKLLGSWYVG